MKSADDIKRLARNAREQMVAGASREDVLSYLRAEGCQALDSIKVLSAAEGISRSESKRRVHMSDTWRDLRSAHDRLHDTIERAIDSNDD